jgi:hypothetical protein
MLRESLYLYAAGVKKLARSGRLSGSLSSLPALFANAPPPPRGRHKKKDLTAGLLCPKVPAMENELQALIKDLSAAKDGGLLPAIAEHANVSRKTVYRILTGKTDPVYSNVTNLRAAARYVMRKTKKSP